MLKKKKIFAFCNAISLRDKCLVIFMFAFILQSASSLFYRSLGLYAGNVDVVVRTTMAAIFGYFISSNFMSKEYVEKKKDTEPKLKVKCECKVEEELAQESEAEQNQDSQNQDNRIQIMIITAIGLISLFILIFAREGVDMPQDALATLSQFRNFVSGCVGFLIGIPPEKKER